MGATLIFEQLLNGFQYGLMLFMVSAGLTLTFGIVNFINLTHSSFYMLGAFFAATFFALFGNFYLAVAVAVVVTWLAGTLIDLLVFRHLYRRSHLDQVLGTFALLAFFNDLVTVVYGTDPRFIQIPPALAGAVKFGDFTYPLYRVVITGVGIAMALMLWFLITRTRLGMLIRAGAERPQTLSGLGINVPAVFSVVFGLGAALAGLAGMVTGPLVSVQAGMGDELLIVAFVVIVIGGIGSVRGAFFAAILVGLVDTMGRFLLPQFLGFTVGPALASMAIYLLMAAFLIARPRAAH